MHTGCLRGTALSFWLCVAVAVGADAGSEDRLRDAWVELGFLNFSEAAGAFTAIRDSCPPGSEDWRRATLGLALCQHHTSPFARRRIRDAVRLYEEILENAPEESRVKP